MTMTLEVTPRTERGKQVQKLRASGIVPGVLYGAQEQATAIAVDKVAFEKVLKEAGESSIITLTGLSEAKEVLVQDVAFDSVRGGVAHVDFYAVEAGKEITTDVPLEFMGEAPAIKLGGTLTKVLHEVEVTCLPNKLPQHIDVDVSVLTDFETQIHIADLVVPEGVSLGEEPDAVVALVVPVKEEVEVAETTIDMNTIAVEKKGKEEVADTASA